MSDQIRDSLDTLLQDLICDMECLDERSFLVDDRQDLIIRDRDESIDLIFESIESIDCLIISLLSLEGEWPRDDSDDESSE